MPSLVVGGEGEVVPLLAGACLPGGARVLGLCGCETWRQEKVDAGVPTALRKTRASCEEEEDDVLHCHTTGALFSRPRPEATVHLSHG